MKKLLLFLIAFCAVGLVARDCRPPAYDTSYWCKQNNHVGFCHQEGDCWVPGL